MNDQNALVPLQDTMQLGKVLADSGYFADSRQAAQAVVKVLAGREMGFGPVASMTGIYIIQGRVSVSANLMAAAIKRSGRYDYRVRQMTAEVCEIEYRERYGDKWETIGVSTFTAADAAKAGTQNMNKFARNMLFARAMSNGARWYCPDIFGGPVYTPEEMGAPVNEDGEIIDGTVRVVEQPKPEQAQPTNGNGNGISKVAPEQSVSAGPTDKQIKAIHAIAGKLYRSADEIASFKTWLLETYGVNSSKELTVSQASEVIDMLKATEEQQTQAA